MVDLVAALRDAGVARVARDVSVSDLTTLRVGGPVAARVVADTDQDLAAVGAVATAVHAPVLVVGRGSNLLVSDVGWPGIAVTLGRGYRGVQISGHRVRAGAAEPLPALAVNVAAAGLSGFAWACAVPGSLGGGVKMNAGAHGREMSHSLVEVECFRLQAQTREVWAGSALEMRYRHTELPSDAVVVAAELALDVADPDVVRAEIAEIRTWRRTHQPINHPNCGSVFTNPPGDSAGRLIEAAGGKGLAVGGAHVSSRHANFVVTRAGATAADVIALIAMVRDRVVDHCGVTLRPEVVTVGEGTRLDPSGDR